MSKLTPYPSYRQTDLPWLGKVPAHWETKPLFAVMKERQRKNIGNKESNVLSLSYGNIIRRDVESNFGLLPESFETYQIVQPGNIVLRLTDLQNDKRSLRTGLVKEKGIITSAYTCLEVGKKVDDKFAHYMLHGYDLLKVFYQLGAGVRQTMKFDDLKRLLVLVPSLKEQQAIAAYLDRQTAKIDALIARKQRLLDLLAERRAALISQAVTKGLSPNVKMKDSGVAWLSQVPSHWEIKRNGSLFRQRDERGRSDLPLLNVSIHTGVSLRELSTEHVEQIASDWSTYKKACKDDIAFNKMRMWQGAVGVTPVDGLVSPDYTVAIPFNNVASKYYEYLFRIDKYKIEINKYSHGIVPDRNRLYWDQFKQMLSIYPPYEEQKKIVEYLDQQLNKMSKLENKVEAAIERLSEYRAALISSVVTGKVQV